MLLDRETAYAYVATGAYDRIMNGDEAAHESELFAITPPLYDPPATVWVVYIDEQPVYRSNHRTDAVRCALRRTGEQAATQLDTIQKVNDLSGNGWRVVELPYTALQQDTPASMPLFGTQWHDDIWRSVTAPLTIDTMLGWGEITTSDAGSISDDIDPSVFEEHAEAWDLDNLSLDELIEVGYDMDEVGAW